ncbi:MAG TPA: glucosaminidase domain-containing protein [Ktedonobacteraceae bacterium]
MSQLKKRGKRGSRSMQWRANLASLALILGLTLLLVMLGVGWILSHANLLGSGIQLDTRYKVTGSPTISASFIDQVLDTYNSPAHGKGQQLYTLGQQYNIDPVYALAFFMHESGFGTTGVARVTLSLGNIRATPGYASYDGYRKYKSWEEGFADWYRLIKKQYVQQWKLSTVAKIIPVYAPSSDHNDVDAYIQSIKTAVDSWRLGQIQV